MLLQEYCAVFGKLNCSTFWVEMVRPNINKTDIHSIFNDISLSDVLSRILYGSTPVKITGIEFHVNMLTFMKLDNNSTNPCDFTYN